MNKSFFEKHLKPKLVFIGSFGACLMSVAYIILVLVLIFGFKVKNIEQSLTFAVINGIVGFIIMQFLKIQGLDFAKQLPENQEIIKKYYGNKTKDKKAHSLKYFWMTSLTKDFLSKAVTIIIATAGLIYIIIEGSQDYTLLLLALVNLIMFISFGLLALVNAYDYFNNTFVPYMIEKLKENEIEINLKEDNNVESRCVIHEQSETDSAQ